MKKLKKFYLKNNSNIKYFLLGSLIVFIIMILAYPKRIAQLKDGSEPILTLKKDTITADDLYNDMKDIYSISILLDKIDRIILEKKYELTTENYAEIKESADYYISAYNEYYEKTEQEFLSENGFASYNDFVEYLTLDYLRNMYYQDYMDDLITEEDIKTYYESSVFGSINSKGITVSNTEDDSDLKLIKEILKKVKKGVSYEEIVNTYGSQIITNEYGYVEFDSQLDITIINALVNMQDNSYSDNYVETSSGYTIVFRLDSKEKEKLETVEKRIVEKLKSKIESEDLYIYYKSLINMRKEEKLTFKDTVLSGKYDQYLEKYE